MKKIVFVFLLLPMMAWSQIIIGDASGTATNKTSVLLEFSKLENRGIVLPYLRSLPSAPVEGSIILDATNPLSAKVKYYNGAWVDLSQDEGNVSSFLNVQPTVEDKGKVVMGADSSPVDGILVLESTNKAMVLPIVTSTDDVVNPSPGMMVYLSNDKLLAIYNGNSWSFWNAN